MEEYALPIGILLLTNKYFISLTRFFIRYIEDFNIFILILLFTFLNLNPRKLTPSYILTTFVFLEFIFNLYSLGNFQK